MEKHRKVCVASRSGRASVVVGLRRRALVDGCLAVGTVVLMPVGDVWYISETINAEGKCE